MPKQQIKSLLLIYSDIIVLKSRINIMNYKILTNVLFLFGGTLLTAFVLKTVANAYYNNDSSNKSKHTYIKHAENNHHKGDIYFPLKEQYGVILKNTKSCQVDSKSLLMEEGYNYSTNSSCINGSCTLSVDFSGKIPKELSVYVDKGGDCTLKKIQVKEHLEVIGYVVNLQLSQAEKDKLHIKENDEIRLAHSNGYSLNNVNKFYFYKNKILEDDILVNDKKKGKVYFSNTRVANTTNTKAVKSNTKIKVPHPKELFSYSCDENRQCEKKANSYIVNVDGLYFIPDDEFIVSCMDDKSSSNYCSSMIQIGNIERPKFDSDAVMNAYIKSTKNPEFNESLEDWEKDRFKKVKDKLMKSIK